MNPAIQDIAARELTRRQHTIWQLHHQTGFSFRRIAIHLDLSRTTVTDHYDAACRKLRAHGVHVTPDGTHYLQNGEHP